MIGLGDWLKQRVGKHLDLRRAPRAGRSDDALAASRKVHEACGNAHAGLIVTVRFERGEERWPAARRRRQWNLIDLYFTRYAGTRCHDDVVGVCPINLCGSYANASASNGIEWLKASQFGPEGAFAT